MSQMLSILASSSVLYSPLTLVRISTIQNQIGNEMR